MTAWEAYKQKNKQNQSGKQNDDASGSSASTGERISPWEDYKRRTASKKTSEEKGESGASKLPQLSYPKNLSAPSGTGSFFYPEDRIRSDAARFEKLYRSDNEQFLSGVKKTVAPYYRQAMEEHRASQPLYRDKSYPGLAATEAVTDLERTIPATVDYYNAQQKYATEVYPYRERAEKTAQAAAEYADSENKLRKAWVSRLDPIEDKKALDDVNSRIQGVEKAIADDQYILDNWPAASWEKPSQAQLAEQQIIKDRISQHKKQLQEYQGEASKAQERYDTYWGHTYAQMQAADSTAKTGNREVAEALPEGLGKIYNAVMFYNNQEGAKKPVIEEHGGIVGTDYTLGHITSMTETEKDLLLYLCNTGQINAAEHLVQEMRGYLTQRHGVKLAEDTDIPVIREALSFANSLGGALQNIGYGMVSMVADVDAPELGVSDYMQSHWGEKHKGTLAGFTTGAAGSIGNMVPMLVANATTGGAAGTMTTFFNSRGSSYVDAKRNGATHGEAWLKSTLTGAAEAGLQALLGQAGGIVKGKIPTKVKDMLSNVAGKLTSHKWAKIAADFAVDVGSEEVEEVSQLFLEPAFDMLAGMSDKYEAPKMEEITETVVVTAMTSAFFFSGDKVGNAAMQRQYDKQIKNSIEKWKATEEGSPLYLAAMSMQEHLAKNKHISPDKVLEIMEQYGANDASPKPSTNSSASYIDQSKGEKAEKLLGKVDESTDAYAISRALHTVGQELTEQGASSIAAELTEKGKSQEEAQQLVGALRKAVNGQRLTSTERKLLQGDKETAEILRAAVKQETATSEEQGTAMQNAADTINRTAEGLARNPVEASTVLPQVESTAASLPENEGFYRAQQSNSTEAAQTANLTGVDETNNISMENTPMDTVVSAEKKAAVRRVLSEQEIPADVAEAFTQDYDGAGELSEESYARAMAEAYYYGEQGIPKEELASGNGLVPLLTERQRNYAYGYGRIAGQTALEQESKAASAKGNYFNKASDSGRVQYEGKISTKNLNKVQKTSLKALDRLAEAMGINIYLYESEMDAEGKPIGENGWYDPKTGDIHIDLNAGEFGQGTMLYTAAHELTHFIRQWSPAQFRVLADFLIENYAEKGVSVSELIRRQQEKARRNGRTLSFTEAYEDMVADSMETMLSDGAVLERIEELRGRDRGLVQKICNWFKAFASKLRRIYKGMEPDTVEGRLVAEMVEKADRLHELFAQGLVDAAENFRDAGGQKNTTDEGGVKYSIRSGLKADLQKVKDRTFPSAQGEVEIGNTSDFLINELGADPLIVTMPATKAYRAMVTEEQAIKDGQPVGEDINYHGLDVDGLYNILERSETPLAAFVAKPSEEGSRFDRIVLVTDVNTAEGLGVVVTEVNTAARVRGKQLSANKDITVYGKDSAVIAVQEAFDNGRLLYVDKNNGQLFDSGRKGSNCPTTISETVRKKNIQDFWANVKWKKSGKDKMTFDGGRKDESPVAAAMRNAGKLRSDRGNLTTRSILTDLDASTVENGLERKYLLEYQENSKNHLIQQQIMREAQERFEALSKEANPDKKKMIAAKVEATKARNRMNVYAERLERAETGGQLRGLIRREVKGALTRAVSKHGAIPAGEKAATDRVVQMPKSMDGESKVSRVARSAAEANMTPKEFVPVIEEAVVNGMLSYDPDTNKAQMDRAHEWLEYNGWKDCMREWTRKTAQNSRLNRDDVARGIALYNNLANQANNAKTEEERIELGKDAICILSDLQTMVTEAAQMVQAMRIMKKQPAEMQYYALKQSVKKIEDGLSERLKKGLPDGIQFNETLVVEWMEAIRSGDESRIEAAQKTLYRDIAAQVPVTFREKWNTWRYLAMLLNPRTHIRNILGNLGFAPVRLVKDSIATGMEAFGGMVSGGRMHRTKTALNFAAKADRALWSAACADYANVQDAIQSGGKYKDSSADEILKERAVFDTKALEWLRKLNEAGLDGEDVWFSKPTYATALAGYLKANGITAEQISNGTVSEAKMNAARAYAIKEAAKATYRDTNEFSKFISGIGKNKSGNQIVSTIDKTAGVLIEGVLPFKKTPANILVRGVGEYSPVGLIRGIKQLAWDVPHGNRTAAEGVDMLASGLTGTILLGVGVWLCSIGLLSGVEDDEEKRIFGDLQGKQNYALNIGDGSYTIDWLAPEALPVFVGAEIAEAYRDNDGTIDTKTVLEIISNISEPILEMSMLSSLNDLLDNISYSDNKLMSILSTAATNYLTQFVPSIFGSIERSGESKRYTTYVDKDNKFLLNDWQYLLANLGNKSPGEYKQIPFVDAWGREEDTGEVAFRLFSNFISPGYYSETVKTPVDDELLRLYEAGQEDVFPDRVSHSYKISYKNGEERVKRYLSSGEYLSYAQTRGQVGLDTLCEICDSDWYAKLNDETKAEVVGYAYDYANELGKKTAVQEYEVDGWEAHAIKGKEMGISPSVFIRAKAATGDITGVKDSEGNTIANSKGLLIMREIYKIGGLSKVQRQFVFAAFGVGKNVIGYSQHEVNQKIKEIGLDK